MKTITLVTGGARSGKSRFALELAAQRRAPIFIATAEVTDDEMAMRIQKHRDERTDAFVTIEEPLALDLALQRVLPKSEVAVIDCLTVWLGNLMHHRGVTASPFAEVDAFLKALATPPCDVVVVSNELGMGIVPEHAMSRWFRDAAGRLNQDVARLSDNLVFMVSGCPLWVKGSPDSTFNTHNRRQL